MNILNFLILSFLNLNFVMKTSNVELVPTHIKLKKSNIINEGTKKYRSDNYSYSNSTDSICEEIQIKVLSRDRTLDSIPTKIAFIITLKSPQKNAKFLIKGIAQLTSSNESFLDSNKPGATPYWAADYNKNDTQYTLNIRLDVENYEACALSIKSNISNQLISYLTYLPVYPKATVLKQGRCR